MISPYIGHVYKNKTNNSPCPVLSMPVSDIAHRNLQTLRFSISLLYLILSELSGILQIHVFPFWW